MPIDIAPEQLPHVNLDSEPLKTGVDAINENFALSLVNQTFYQYETFRSQYSDIRWNVSDTLYYGYLPGKYWEGTVIPRSALGMPIVFDQIESALPAICQEIFAPQDEWFQVETEPGSSVQEAREVQEHLGYVLEHSKNDYSTSGRDELELAFKSALLYGNGGISLEYDSILQRPVIQWVDIRDFYIDPGCPTPNVDEARSIIRRKFMTVDELVTRRGDSRMKIPSDEVLYHMANNPLFAVGDQTKSNQEAIRGVSYTPGTSDYSPNPAERKIEVLLYYTATRIIWVLNRQVVAYNEPNPYGFIPFCFAPYAIVPSRFYAQSIADVQEGNQRYIEALLNGRLDQITLELQPPRVYKQGTMMTPAQLKWRPGATYQVGDAKDMSLLQPATQLANVYSEIQYIENAAEKRTGLNTSGVPTPSNANRTAAGSQIVNNASVSRLRQTVSNFERYLIVPMLYKLYTIIQKHTLPGTSLTGVSKEGSLTQVKSDSFQNKMRFRMLSSSRMMTREKLAAMFPFLTQYMMNGTFLQGIQKTGQTIDFNELFKMLQDATGTGRLYNFIRPMNQQEQQAMQAPPPEVIADQQKTQAELQTRMQLEEKKSQTALQVAQISNQPNPQEMQNEQIRMQMEMQREASRVKSEQMLAQIKIMAEREKNAMNAQAKRQELQGKQAEIGMKLQSSQVESALGIQQMQQQSEMQNQQAQQTHQQTMQQGQETHEVNLDNLRKQAQVKANLPKKKGETKSRPKAPK